MPQALLCLSCGAQCLSSAGRAASRLRHVSAAMQGIQKQHGLDDYAKIKDEATLDMVSPTIGRELLAERCLASDPMLMCCTAVSYACLRWTVMGLSWSGPLHWQPVQWLTVCAIDVCCSTSSSWPRFASLPLTAWMP